MKGKTPKANKEKIIRDQYTVVLEGLRSDFKVFGESLTGLKEKTEASFKKIDDKLDHHTEMFREVYERLDGHTEKLDSHTQKLDSHTEMIGRLMIDVQEIKNDLKQKVDRNEFSRLEKRVLMLEQQNHSIR